MRLALTRLGVGTPVISTLKIQFKCIPLCRRSPADTLRGPINLFILNISLLNFDTTFSFYFQHLTLFCLIEFSYSRIYPTRLSRMYHIDYENSDRQTRYLRLLMFKYLLLFFFNTCFTKIRTDRVYKDRI